MARGMKIINLWSTTFPCKKAGGTNGYLVKSGDGYILIDTGWPSKRDELIKEMESAGCKPGNLKLIIATHGDIDHTGNCAYLRERYKTKIAIHPDESKVVETGNMLLSRKNICFFQRTIAKVMFFFFGAFVEIDKFEPDLLIDEGYDLSEYGLDATVLHLPGHSKGSIGILTSDGDLYCADILGNNKKPEKGSLVDDKEQFNASIEKLEDFEINTVYPGHGKPFLMKEFLETLQ